jgi:hypothetical protein
MTARKCPWCGGPNLRIKNVMSNDRIYWEDRDCGYREVTTDDERYDYDLAEMIQQEMKIVSFHKPTAPLPVREQPEYLRIGIVAIIPKEQQTIGVLV